LADREIFGGKAELSVTGTRSAPDWKARYDTLSPRRNPMGTFGIWHWIIVLIVVLVLFGGRGKISSLMGDVAHGIRNFRDGLKDPEQKKLAENESEGAKERDKV
jgi:sec-independent protein translocase protein TatA